MQLLDLAAADQELGGGLVAGNIDEANRFRPRRTRQLLNS